MSFIKKFLTPVTEAPVLDKAPEILPTPEIKETVVSERSDNLFPFTSQKQETVPCAETPSDTDIYRKPLETYTTEDFMKLFSEMLSVIDAEARSRAEEIGKAKSEVKAEAAPEVKPEIKPVAKAEPKTAKEPLTISSYFKNKGILLYAVPGRESIPALESLAFTIAINYPFTKHFIRFLRDKIVKKDFEFSYNISSLTPADRSSVTALAEKLDEYGYICWKNKAAAGSFIKGTISSCPKCINFINGSFMELYAKSVTVGVIKRLSEKLGLDYEILTNVYIEKGDEKHELDLVFRIGRQVFWGEVKSSDFDADKYRKIGILMGVVPDRLILLAAEKSNEAAAAISHNYDYYCANISTFKSSITEMINNAFREEK